MIPCLRPNAEPVFPGEVDPIGHLREYNNYLSPRLGFFSADTWTLAATVGRNILLNWLVLVPLLMLALMLPRLVLAVFRLGETYREMGSVRGPSLRRGQSKKACRCCGFFCSPSPYSISAATCPVQEAETTPKVTFSGRFWLRLRAQFFVS